MRATAGPGGPVLLLALSLAASQGPAEGQQFEEVAAEIGIDFTHRHFATGQKHMPENMGAGVAIFDSDGDGRLDIYLVQGAGSLPGATPDPTATNRLFRQAIDGTFVDATVEAGVGDTGYGMGAAFGDIDGDEDLDLFVTNYGPDVLYRNLGDGTFEDVSSDSRTSGGDRWSASAGFFDADGDGDLDLYVTRYLDWSPDGAKYCGNAQAGIRSYCHPDVYDGEPDTLYRNDGHGRFENVSEDSGILATTSDKGLGLVLADLDGNGTQDIYVANDSTRNYLYLGAGEGIFQEDALLSGVAVNGLGAKEAGMGVELGDLDGDGLPDLFLTHLDEETNTLYTSDGPGQWADRTAASGLGLPSRPWVGFGTALLDYDNDGDEDVFVTNGHIVDNIALFDPSRSHRQPSQLFESHGRLSYRERSDLLGLSTPGIGRGAVAADLEGDGDMDLVITQNGGSTLVLRNLGSPGLSVAFRLVDQKSTPGFGARLQLKTETSRQVRWLKASTSYLSQGPPRVHFGLGTDPETVDLEVRWPSGQVSQFDTLETGFVYTLREANRDTTRVPFFAHAPD